MLHHTAPRVLPCRGRCLGALLAVLLLGIGFLSQVTFAHSVPVLAILAAFILTGGLAVFLFKLRHPS